MAAVSRENWVERIRDPKIECMSRDEMAALQSRRLVEVVNRVYNNVEFYRKKMQDMGINIAIGTDGPASNNCLDMFREMYLMTGLQKIACDDASACPADSVLKAATVGSARAMGLSDCDIIAEGKQADLIVIDLFQPNMQPLNNIGKNLVYSGSKQNVKLTMCAGKVLYEDGEFRIGEEPAVIYKKANEIIESMKD